MTTEAELLDISDAEYRQIDAISQSTLKAFGRDPWKFYRQHVAKDLPPDEPTASMKYGSTLEKYLLYGEGPPAILIPPEVLNADGHRKGNPWKQFAEQAAAAYPGHDLLKADEYMALMEPLERSREQVLAHPLAAERLWARGAEYHRAIVWRDPITGELCKCQLDVLHWDERSIDDLKTTADVRRPAWERQVLNLGYHLQQAWYRRATRALESDADWTFNFVCVKNKCSWDVEVYRLKPTWQDLADAALSEALVAYTQAKATNRWRSATHGQLVTLDVPNYAWGTLDLDMETE